MCTPASLEEEEAPSTLLVATEHDSSRSLPVMTAERASRCSWNEWLVRKPRLPMLNEITGGIALRKSDDACRTRPSPPRQTTKSTVEASEEASSSV